jgi:hypothetical protein
MLAFAVGGFTVGAMVARKEVPIVMVRLFAIIRHHDSETCSQQKEDLAQVGIFEQRRILMALLDELLNVVCWP